MTKHPLRIALAAATTAMVLAACTPSDPAAPTAAPTVSAADAAAPAPAGPVDANGPAQRYDGKIVRQPPGAGGKDDGWFLVKGGERRWIMDGAWLGRNGYSPEQVVEITHEEFMAIPEGAAPISE